MTTSAVVAATDGTLVIADESTTTAVVGELIAASGDASTPEVEEVSMDQELLSPAQFRKEQAAAKRFLFLHEALEEFCFILLNVGRIERKIHAYFYTSANTQAPKIEGKEFIDEYRILKNYSISDNCDTYRWGNVDVLIATCYIVVRC